MEQPPHVERSELDAVLRDLGFVSPLVSQAFDLAELVHRSQKRAGGAPYLEEHVYPVTLEVARYLSGREGDAEDAVIVALLHDTVEDSDAVDREVIEERFGPRIAEWVDVLTKPETEDKSELRKRSAEQRYIGRITAAPFPVRAIKVFDRLNNLAGLYLRKPEERHEYLRETREHFLDLARAVDPALYDRMTQLVHQAERVG